MQMTSTIRETLESYHPISRGDDGGSDGNLSRNLCVSRLCDRDGEARQKSGARLGDPWRRTHLMGDFRKSVAAFIRTS